MSLNLDQQLKCRKQKASQEICRKILENLLHEESNQSCADCYAKGTQWASWNLGIFLCIRCAGIHRNLGVHISRVKSVYLDSWSEENVHMLQQIGNGKAKEIYEACIPKSVQKQRHDPNIESWIRMKYEYKKFMLKNWVPPQYKKEKQSPKFKQRSGKHKKHKIGSSADVLVAGTSACPVEQLSSHNDECSISLLNLSEIRTSGSKKLKDVSSESADVVIMPSIANFSEKGITLQSSLWQ